MANKYRTTESYRDEVHALTDGEYAVGGEYKNVETPILHRHNCGFAWNVKPNHFVNTGSRCPKCFGNAKKTHAEYLAEVQSLVGDQFTVIGQYVNATTLIFHRHNAEGCGFQWRIQPNAFLRGNRCPRCQESKGARRVAKVLDSLGVSYSREFRFNDCRSINPLPFDFCVQTESGPILIEYDGEQHHVPFDRFGGDEGLAERQRRDRIKTDYCCANNIELIRIPYWDFDRIEDILIGTISRNALAYI